MILGASFINSLVVVFVVVVAFLPSYSEVRLEEVVI